MVKMNNLTKSLVSLYLAANLCGCATQNFSYKDTQKIQPVPNRKITFVQQNTRSLDSMISASEDFNNSFRYTGRLDQIKQKIITSKTYNPTQEIRRLARDIENSNLGDKSNLLKIVKDFSYYKEEQITKGRKWQPIQYKIDGMGSYTIGSVVGVGYAVGMTVSDKGEGNGSRYVEEGILLGITTGLLVYFWKKMPGYRKQKKYFRRVLVKPYYGTEEVIKTW